MVESITIIANNNNIILIIIIIKVLLVTWFLSFVPDHLFISISEIETDCNWFISSQE